MTPETYAELSATEIARRVAARDVSAIAVTEAALARITATEPRTNAFIHVEDEAARAAAAQVDTAIASGRVPGPLAGVPVSVKDLVHVAGQPTSFGSRAFAGRPAPGDAAPIANLRAAGAILIGKTTTPEFGHKAITEGALFGATLNPWNRDFTSGGSSGGAAASLAAGQVPLAVGTDGGGSVRIPASVCGVFGLKATLGRVAHVHAPDLFANAAYIGPMARTLDDLATMYGVMAGEAAGDPWSRPRVEAPVAAGLDSQRIGWAITVGNPAVAPEVAAAVENALSQLRQGGAALTPLMVDWHRREPAFRAQLEAGLAGRLGATLERDRDRFDASLVTTIENGLGRSGVEVAEAAAARSELYREIEALFESFDLLVTPVLATPSMPAGTDTHADAIIDGTNCGRIRAGWYPYTFPFNLTGHPALSLPCGWTSEGLPVGLQIVGRWDEEARVLDTARQLTERLALPLRRLQF